eukprot:614202-Amphidinium_carterae.1
MPSTGGNMCCNCAFWCFIATEAKSGSSSHSPSSSFLQLSITGNVGSDDKPSVSKLPGIAG